jgi:hypothetical protein
MAAPGIALSFSFFLVHTCPEDYWKVESGNRDVGGYIARHG